VVIVADDDGFPFLDSVNRVVTVLLRRLARGERTHLVLPNPDLIFPAGADAFGITAGAIAAMLEAVMRLRDPTGAHRFIPLGKPHLPMFEAAVRHFGMERHRLVMVGDQLGTDILGANRARVDSALVLTGVARLADLAASEARPTWVLDGVS
jgi:ribonucleotide monophosphatase NagD (HAD superfamily)